MASTTSAAARPAPARTAGVICAVLGALGFSFKAIFVKSAYRYGVDAETLLCLRMAYALPLFVLMAWNVQRREARSLTRHDWTELLALGALGYYLASYLDFLGLQHISAALERIVLFIYPTLVTLISALLQRQRPSRRTLALLALSYAGVALSVAPDLRVGAGSTMLGVTLVLASAAAYALFLVGSGQLVLRLGSTRATAYATGVACVLCIAQFLIVRPVAALAQPWQVHALALCMAALSTVLPIWMVNEAIRRLGAANASMIGSLGPIFTILLAGVLLGERLQALQLVGAAVVIYAVSRLTRRA